MGNRKPASAAVAAIVLLVAGCATGGAVRPSGLAGLPAGSRLVIDRAVTIPAGETRVFFQHGERRGAQQITVWNYNCALHLDHALTRPYTVSPGVLPVLRVRAGEEPWTWGRGVMVYYTDFYVAPPPASPLRRLHCEIWTDWYSRDAHITRAELRRTLGPWLHLEPPAGVSQ